MYMTYIGIRVSAEYIIGLQSEALLDSNLGNITT
jgi:hypothetical protein